MGKKVKKNARSGQKEKRVSSSCPKTTSQASQQSTLSNIEATDDGNTVLKGKSVCPHVEKGVNLEKLSAKFGSSESLKCEFCRVASKGKAKQGKKKGGAESRSECRAIWVCLECGHFSCGGVGLPTTPQTHAIRHARQDRHPLAIQFENPLLRWCFSCNMLIPTEKSGDGVENKDVFHEVVKMMKVQPSEGPALDVDKFWFGSGSVASGIVSENSAAVSSGGRGSYLVRGLVNLGNTCFFNSVMQNLLALDRLRDHFCKLDGSVGPLTAALEKLIVETNPDSGLRNVINPTSFFGCVCAKAPQFRGYQQQDSHELIRCLLDGLSTEELSARKQNKSSHENGNSAPTFVDAIFGGQLSSTVTCLECGHSSLIYEPFLDLSLPIPSRKQPSKSVTRAKKPKPPPKRNNKVRPKFSRDTTTLPSVSTSDVSVGGKSSCLAQSTTNVPQQNTVSSGDSDLLASADASVMNGSKSITSHSLSSAQNTESNQVIENVVDKPTPADDFTWLDFLEADRVSEDDNVTSQMDDLSANHGSADENAVQNSVSLNYSSERSGDNISTCTNTSCCSYNGPWLDHREQEKLLDAQDMASQINEKLVLEESGIMDAIKSEVRWGNGSESCSLTCSRDLNIGVDSSGKFSEEETQLLVQDSEVILLPYKEDTLVTNEILKTEGVFSSSALIQDTDSLEFDGIGDLFNEPETAIPSMKPSYVDNTSQANEVVQAGFVGNSSESDPDEVDNTDAPASVESCLSHFTKSELLSKNEHAWQCENCSKVLREQRMRLGRKFQNPRSENVIDRGINTITSGLSCLTENRPLSSEVGHLCNGNLRNETVDASDDGFLSHDNKSDGKLNFMLGNGEKADLNTVASRMEDIKWEADLAPVCAPEYSVGDKNCCKLDKNCDGCHVNEPSFDASADGDVQKEEFHRGTARCKSEGSEDEENNSKIVKVERDATKRILINRAPPILTIHLKRFNTDARGRLGKLNGYVQFNHTIDLKPYMDPRSLDRDKYKYHLVGVVEHSGTMRRGHYVAYVRGGMKTTGKAENKNGDYIWYHASDAYVREVSFEEVLRSEAYILFYERI